MEKTRKWLPARVDRVDCVVVAVHGLMGLVFMESAVMKVKRMSTVIMLL